MPLKPTRTIAPIATGALTLCLAATPVAAAPTHAAPADAPAAQAAPASPSQGKDGTYRGEVEVVPGADEDQQTLDGVVFDDRNQNSTQDRGERGVKGVSVSNGREVVTTDAKGRYELPVDENTNVFVTQPAGYQVPVDDDNVAQFSYIHLPEGSPDLKYGGIEPTGELPDAVNFPMARSQQTKKPQQNCIIGGDVQTYTQEEVGYARTGAFTDLAQRDDYAGCGALFLGDIVGDDLSLYDQTRELTGMVNGPVRMLPGNHDLDYDAQSEHRFDTYRSQFGADYYSYDVGNMHIVALDSVQYPKDDSYYGALGEEQLEWLRQDIAQVPKQKTVVLAAHIPLVDYVDQAESKHQVKEVKEIHEIVAGHEAIAFGGHSHSTEFNRAGDSTAGWQETLGVSELPFDHITAGAISGDWYSGRLDENGVPTALQRDGARPGVLTLQSQPNARSERFTVTGGDESNQMNVGVNTPRYREWFEANKDVEDGGAPEFENPNRVSSEDLADGTYLTANVFAGSTGSDVTVSVDGDEAKGATRTQSMTGEARKVGALWSDPVAVQEQLVHGGSVADSSMHLWRLQLPKDLAPGEHTAKVTSTDRYGVTSTDTIDFTVTE